MSTIVQALLWVAGGGAFGGLVLGLVTQGGFIKPQPLDRDVQLPGNIIAPVRLMVPGTLGTVLTSAVTALVVYMVERKTYLVVGTNKDAITLSFAEVGLAIFVGIASTGILASWVKGQNWSKVAPVLQQMEPGTAPPVGPDPVAALMAISGNSTTNGNPTEADITGEPEETTPVTT